MIRLSSPEKKRGNQPSREQNTPYLLLTLISAAENFVKLLFDYFFRIIYIFSNVILFLFYAFYFNFLKNLKKIVLFYKNIFYENKKKKIINTKSFLSIKNF